MSKEFKDAFIRPDTMVERGGFPDLDFMGEVVGVKVIPYCYNNATDKEGNFYPWTWAVQFDLQPDEDEDSTDIVTKWYGIVTKNDGFENFRSIDESDQKVNLPEDLEDMREDPHQYGGVRLVYVGKDKDWEGLTLNTTWWEFAGHLQDKGVLIEEDATDYTFFLGVSGHWHEIPQADRGFKKKKGKENKILVLAELNEHKKVEAAAGTTSRRNMGGSDNGAIKYKLFGVIDDALPEGESLSMGKVSVLIARNFPEDERNEARKALAPDSSFWDEFGLQCVNRQVSVVA